MKNKPLISVIMGVYNPNEKYFKSAIDSIINQTLRDFEFIICDDGSTINKHLFNNLSQIDDRIIVIKNDTNMGLAYTLNKCIKISKGAYIARQDADDISELNRLEKQVNFLENNKQYDFVGTNIKYMSDGKIWGEYKLKETPSKKDFLFRVPFMHGTILYRAEIFKYNYYRIAIETRRCEDYDFFMHLYSEGFTAYNIQQTLYVVREDKEALNRRKFKYRVDEVKVRLIGFKKLRFPWYYYFLIFKPILVALIPKKILNIIKDIVYKRKLESK